MKRIAFIIITLSMFLSLLGCDGSQSKTKSSPLQCDTPTNLKKIDKQLKNVSGINYGFYEIYPDLQKFLKRDSEYKDIYSDNKKIIFYFCDSGCSYIDFFSNTMKNFKDNDYYKNYYYFRPQKSGNPLVCDYENRQTLIDFCDARGYFCIFNPEKKQVFTVSSMGRNEASQIENILDELLEW